MRIGVNIPDKLLQRVKEIQPEVNVSQVCREALEARATLAERVRAKVQEDGMVSHIHRFFEPGHAPLPEPDWLGIGIDDARNWVESVNPKEWHHVNGFYDRSLDKENCSPLVFEIGMASNRRLGDHRGWDTQCYRRGELGARNEAFSRYRDAWLSYYREVRSLEDRLMEERRAELMAEYKERWESRPKPAMPARLQE